MQEIIAFPMGETESLGLVPLNLPIPIKSFGGREFLLHGVYMPQ